MDTLVYNFHFNLKTKLFALLLLMSFQINAQISFSNQNSLLQNSDFHSGVAIGIADMNGDGKDDIVRYNQGYDLHIEYQTAPNSLFQTYHFGAVSSASEWSTCIADYDKNGYNDILVSGNYDNIKMLKANANGTAYTSSLLPSSNIFIQGSNFVDIDNDGWVDVFACHDDATSRSYHNNTNGTFTFDNSLINTQMSSGNSGNYASSWIDYDNDGDLDMYLSKCRQGVTDPTDLRRINRLFQNDGNNNFTDVAAAANMAFGDQSWSADFADIDNDGDLDCFIINHYTSSLLMLNNGDGSFSNITPTSGMQNDLDFFGIQAIFRDFDNDGFVDLVISGTEDRLFRNNGNNTFTNTSFSFSSNDMESFAIGDLNGDGYLDIYAGYANLFTSPTTIDDVLWMNDGGANNFFSVLLEGTASNINGIGARVELHGAWGIQIREVQSGEAYGISNSFVKHFGIGTATQIDKLVIKWPSGIINEILNPAINQVLNVVENNLTDQTINFPGISNKLTTDAAFNISASASSGLPVSFEIISGPATISSNTITLSGAVGTVVVRASQSGNTQYNPAPDVDRSFNVTEPTGNCTATSNLALNKTTTQSSVVFGAVASRAVDGNTDGVFLNNSVIATNMELNAWWEVDLGDVFEIENINLWNRTDNRPDRLSNYYVFVSDVPFSSNNLNTTINQSGVSNYYQSENAGTPSAIIVGRTGRYVRVQLNYTEHLTIAEVEVIGCSTGNDTTPPDVTLSTPSSNVTGSFPVAVNFTEAITGLTLSDFTLTNGTATNLNGSGASYSISVNPIIDGQVTVLLPVDQVTDNAGNGNTISNLLTVNYTEGGGENCTVTNNLALNKTATQSSVVFGAVASRAVDGNTNGDFLANSVVATNNELNAWWEVDLGDVYQIDEVNLWNRTDNRQDRLSNFYLLVSDVPFSSNNLNTVLAQAGVDNYYQSAQAVTPSVITVGRTGRYVRVQLNYAEHLTIAEVEVMGCSTGTDVTPPTVVLSTSSNIVNSAFIVNADFSEGVTGFTLSDLTVTNGTASAINGSGANYNFTITPTIDGLVNIQLPQNTVSDGAGNPNTISNNLQVTYDSGLINEDYCTSVSDFPWHEWISGVKLGTIDNTSGKNPYSDFTNISTTLSVGQNYNIDLTASFSYNLFDQYWRVWIDLNQDNDFDDPGEMLFEDIMVNPFVGSIGETLSGSITIPATATNGNTRMRVTMSREAYASSCGPIDFGEVEDYTINIAGASSATGTSARALLYLIANKENQKVQLEWITNSELENNYFVIERSIDGENFEEIGNLDSKFDTNRAATSYHFEDSSPENGDNYYRIRKIHHDGTELLSELRKITFDADIEAISYFPNPSVGEIWLNLKPFAGKQATLFLYNSLGQQQETADIPQIPNTPMLLDLSPYQNGIYYIKIKVEGNRQFTRKVVLNRMY